MNDKMDFTVLILRFAFGAILGTILALMLSTPLFWASVLTGKMVLMIGGAAGTALGILAAMFGDKFLVGVMKIMRFFRFTACF